MTSLTPMQWQPAVRLDGDPGVLLDQVGAARELALPALASSACRPREVRSLPALRSFLQNYRTEILLPIELPVILSAHAHAARGETRELITMDRCLADLPELKDYAAASCRVGQRHLNRLRPMRDLRLVRRYRAAIERGEAHGWHTVVYGLTLAVFSLPLRQGLAAYAHRTLGGFIAGAARPLRLTDSQCEEALAAASDGVAQAVHTLLDSSRSLHH
jgi:urease accessory protein UreF